MRYREHIDIGFVNPYASNLMIEMSVCNRYRGKVAGSTANSIHPVPLMGYLNEPLTLWIDYT